MSPSRETTSSCARGAGTTTRSTASNNVAATIELPLRPWQVSAGGGSIWASQFEGTFDGGFLNPVTWDVARIDEGTTEVTNHPVAGAFGVTWEATPCGSPSRAAAATPWPGWRSTARADPRATNQYGVWAMPDSSRAV